MLFKKKKKLWGHYYRQRLFTKTEEKWKKKQTRIESDRIGRNTWPNLRKGRANRKRKRPNNKRQSKRKETSLLAKIGSLNERFNGIISRPKQGSFSTIFSQSSPPPSSFPKILLFFFFLFFFFDRLSHSTGPSPPPRRRFVASALFVFSWFFFLFLWWNFLGFRWNLPLFFHSTDDG